MSEEPPVTKRGNRLFSAETTFGLRTIQALLSRVNVRFGAVDVVVIGERGLGRSRAFMLLPSLSSKADDKQPSAVTAIPSDWEYLFEHGLTDDERELIGDRKPIIVSSFNTADVKAALESVPSNSLVLVSDAHRYRHDGLPPSHFLDEDAWIPHVVALGAMCVSVAMARSLYVVIDCGCDYPTSPVARNRLLCVEHCGVVGNLTASEAEDSLRQKMQSWDERVERGDLHGTLREIDGDSDLVPDQKIMLKAITLARFGRAIEALRLLQVRMYEILASAAAPQMLLVARIARDASNHEIVTQVVDRLATMQLSIEQMVAAIDLAEHVGASAAAQELVGALHRGHGDSLHALRYALDEAVFKIDAASISSALAAPRASQLSDEERRFYVLLEAVCKSNDPETRRYVCAVIDAELPAMSARARSIVARLARASGDDREVLEVLRDCDAPSRDLLRIAIDSLENLSIRSRGQKALGIDEMLRYVSRLVYLVAQDPSDGVSRVALLRVLSLETVGTSGMAILAFLASDSASSVLLADEEESPTERVPPEEFEGYVSKLISETPKPILIGTGAAEDMSRKRADALMRHARVLLDRLTSINISDSATESLYLALHVAMLTARASSNPDEEIECLRIVAGCLVGHARFQSARDLIEGALQSTDLLGSDSRKHAVWAAHSDVYLRVQNLHEALLGLACVAVFREIPMGRRRAIEFLVLVVRVLRDFGMFDAIDPLIDQVTKLSVQEGGLGRTHRIRTLALSVDVRRLQCGQGNGSDWCSLLERICDNYEEVLREEDETGPVATLLVQAVLFCEWADAEPPERARLLAQSVGDSLQHLPRVAASIAALSPDLKIVSRVVANLEETAANEDLGYDLRIAGIAIARLLTSPTLATEEAALGIELLARSAGRQLTGNAIGTDLETLAEGTCERLALYSRSGCVVHCLGLDSNSRLIRVTARDGVVGPVVREAVDVFSMDAVREWREFYPFEYCNTTSSDALLSNQAYLSVRGIGISAEVAPVVAIIAEPRLQEIPVNVWMLDDDFIGRQAAVAALPSMSWIEGVRAAQLPRGRARIAWVSSAHEEGTDGTLATLGVRLKPTLDEHGIALVSEHLPPRLSGAGIAIVAAHGGILPEGRYFSVVSDEGSFRASARAVAQLFEDTALVILFVCSGGRIDGNPFSYATIGFPRLLLDRGCRAVVAPAWPLDSRVPAYWLPSFLNSSAEGSCVAVAAHCANRAVASRFSDAMGHSLAMHVFGDPMLKASDW